MLSRLSLLLFTLLSPRLAFGEETDGGRFVQPTDTTLGDGFSNPDEVTSFIYTIANWIFAIFLAVAVIYILLAAWEYLTSKGGEGVEKAHKMLIYAAVAVVVAVLARGIVTVARVLVTGTS